MALHSTSSNVTADLTANAERDGAASSDATSIRSVPVGSLASMTAGQVLMNDGAGSLIAASVPDGIGTGTITADMIAAGAVLAEIGTGGITETYIGNGAVTENKIGAGAVTSTKIGGGAVGSTALASDGVTGPKVHADNTFLRNFSMSGRNGAGACTLTGAKVGDKLLSAAFVAGTVPTANPSFEATITVADQLQQGSGEDLSGTVFSVLVLRKSL